MLENLKMSYLTGTAAIIFYYDDIIRNCEVMLNDNELRKIASIVQKHDGFNEFFNGVCDNAIELVLSERDGARK